MAKKPRTQKQKEAAIAAIEAAPVTPVPPVAPSLAHPVQEPPLPDSVARAIRASTVIDSANRRNVTASARTRLDVGDSEADVIAWIQGR